MKSSYHIVFGLALNSNINHSPTCSTLSRMQAISVSSSVFLNCSRKARSTSVLRTPWIISTNFSLFMMYLILQNRSCVNWFEKVCLFYALKGSSCFLISFSYLSNITPASARISSLFSYKIVSSA